MKTYWIIWPFSKETRNGYNQAVFRTIKELINYLEEAYGPDYSDILLDVRGLCHIKELVVDKIHENVIVI